MPSQNLKLAANTSTDIVDELSLADGTSYLIQNLDPSRILRFKEAVTDPGANKGHILEPRATWGFTVGSDPLWARFGGGPGEIEVTESE